MTDAEKLRLAVAALQEIVDPIPAAYDRLGPDDAVDFGKMVRLPMDAPHLARVARRALKQLGEVDEWQRS